MRIERLDASNVEQYLAYLHRALKDEPDMMTIDEVDDEAIMSRVNSNQNTSISLLAIKNEEVIGRIEYHFYGCIQDGYQMAYVNWLYVAREWRHQGIAQALFAAFEEDCREHHIDEYFLIQANNSNAKKFYGSFKEAKVSSELILRQSIY